MQTRSGCEYKILHDPLENTSVKVTKSGRAERNCRAGESSALPTAISTANWGARCSPS